MIGTMNKNHSNNLAKAALSVAFLLAGSAVTLTSASAQQILLTCTPPLVANSDGTDCVRPAVQQKTPDRLTAFSIRTGDGRHLGLYRKINDSTWLGPRPDNGESTKWRHEDANSRELTLAAVRSQIIIRVMDNGEVFSKKLPSGSVLGDRAY